MKISDVLNEIQDKIEEKNNVKRTNRALAEFIGIDEKRIPEYRSGREPMDDDYAKIALASGYTLEQLKAMVKLDEGRSEESRAIWEKYYKRFGGIAASVALAFFCLVTLIVTPSPAEALPLLDEPIPTLCIMLSLYVIGIRINAFVKNTPANAFRHSCFSG